MSRRSIRRKKANLLSTPRHVVCNVTALAAGGSCVATIVEELPFEASLTKNPPASLVGKKIFVPFTIPGESATARVTKDLKSYCEGDLISITTSSSARTAPPCPHFGSCGGCDLQHITLEHQREMKLRMVAQELSKHGSIPIDGVSLLAPHLKGLGYRRRMSFHLNNRGEFGLYRKNGRQIIPIGHCPIATDTINSALERHLALFVACGPEAETVTLEDHEGEIYLAIEVHPRAKEAVDILVAKPAFKVLCEEIRNVQVNYRHKPEFIVRAGVRDTKAEPPIGHFSQNNALANQAMIEEIARLVRTDAVTDLYAGAGNISLPLAARGHQVNAVEVDSHLVEFGTRRAALQGLSDKVTFVQQTCERWIEHGTPDPTVVLDPPRGGAFEVAKRLSPSVSPHLVYVSCYPPTFVRDCVELVGRGYTCVGVKVLDMFPQTYHAEIVAEFRGR